MRSASLSWAAPRIIAPETRCGETVSCVDVFDAELCRHDVT
jgi:hypothetical protein